MNLRGIVLLNGGKMKQEDVEVYNKTMGQLRVTITEIKELSKKKPDGGVNEFKLQHINSIIKDANLLLGEDLRPFSDFTIFDKDNIPTNSDVSFILAQYSLSMRKYYQSNTRKEGMSSYWIIDGKVTRQEADY